MYKSRPQRTLWAAAPPGRARSPPPPFLSLAPSDPNPYPDPNPNQEPHGMLLEGVVRHLPRKHYHVVVCPIDTAGKRLSPRLADAADEVVRLPMKLEVARSLLGGLR